MRLIDRSVLARIRLPMDAATPIDDSRIDYIGRRVLYSVDSLRLLTLALA